MSDLPPINDPIGEALHFLRISGAFYARCEVSAPWAVDLPAMDDFLMFHIVTQGECRVLVADAPPLILRPGSFALVPHGAGHLMSSGEGVAPAKLFDLPRDFSADRYEIIRHGGGGAPTTIICGAVRLEHPAAQQLLPLLPKVIHVGAWTSPEMDWIESTLRFIAAEARELRAGGETIITRLADILVIQAIRTWIARDPGARTGWLGALRDRQIGQAIAAIHRDPRPDWTVATLAAGVGMSRSAFAARFTELVGEPVMHYVARWRMQTAVMWLREEGASVGAVAGRLGYESDAAFSRTFKRVMGSSPGAVRRNTAR
ncbi:MAG: AraC family transcriptional regulator [Rhodospirillaceae bacterium]|nr:AraC family transcriptional regulator [Rhodospirillaceae bacterium]